MNNHEITTIRTFNEFRDLCIGRRLNVSQIAYLAAKIKFVWISDDGQYTPDILMDALAKFHATYGHHDERPIFLDAPDHAATIAGTKPADMANRRT